MEQPNNIDQLFRERLQGAEVPPPAFVWPNVERALRQRRRRFFFWLWFGLGLTGAGSWALWATNRPAPSALVTAPRAAAVPAAGPGALPAQDEKYARTEIATRDEDYARTGPASPAEQAVAGSAAGKKIPGMIARGSQRGVTVRPVSPIATERLPGSEAWTDAGNGPLTKNFAAAGLLTPLPSTASPLFSKTRKSGLILPKAKPFFTKKKTLKNCYDFAQHAQVWLFDVYAGPSLPQRELTAAEPAFNAYADQRRHTERTDWAFNAGLRGSLLFGRHFLLRSGLHYEQMTEVFEYADPDFKEVTIRQTTKIVDGMLVTVIDTLKVSYGDHYVKTYNRYGQLDVPLLAGVEFRRGRLGLSLQAGASLNVYFWKRGTVLNAQGDPQRFTPGAEGAAPVFRNRAGWSSTASLQLFCHLRPRLRIFAEPYYSHTLRPLTLDGQPIAQRYTTLGLKLGITKIFD